MKLMKRKLAVLTAVMLSPLANASNHNIELELSLSGEVNELEEIVKVISAEVFSGIDAIPEANRTSGQTELWTTLDYAINNADLTDPTQQAQVTKIYEAISPKTNSASTIVTRKNPGTISVKGIGKRLSALRKSAARVGFFRSMYNRSSRSENLASLLPGYARYNNPNEAGGLFDQRLSGFITGNAIVAKQSETSTEAGFDGATQQLTLGADYRFTNNTFAGAALSIISGEMDISNDGGTLNNTAQTLLFYGTHNLKPDWYVDATFNMGKREFDMERNVSFTAGSSTTQQVAKSSPDSDYLGLSVGTGYDLSWDNGHSISLNGGLNYTQTTISAFQETSGGGFNLNVSEQTIDSLKLNLGAEWRQAISTSFGIILPQLAINYTQEFEDKGDAINAYFVSDPNKNAIKFETGNKDLNYVSILLGVSAVMPRGLTVFAQYETQQFVEDYQQYMISLGARKEF